MVPRTSDPQGRKNLKTQKMFVEEIKKRNTTMAYTSGSVVVDAGKIKLN